MLLQHFILASLRNSQDFDTGGSDGARADTTFLPPGTYGLGSLGLPQAAAMFSPIKLIVYLAQQWSSDQRAQGTHNMLKNCLGTTMVI